MTPHTRIPLNQGICGAAASSGKTIVVDDVSKDPRYLACSLETKSEIVVPIFVKEPGRRRTRHRQPLSRPRSEPKTRNWSNTALKSWGKSWRSGS